MLDPQDGAGLGAKFLFTAGDFAQLAEDETPNACASAAGAPARKASSVPISNATASSATSDARIR